MFYQILYKQKCIQNATKKILRSEMLFPLQYRTLYYIPYIKYHTCKNSNSIRHPQFLFQRTFKQKAGSEVSWVPFVCSISAYYCDVWPLISVHIPEILDNIHFTGFCVKLLRTTECAAMRNRYIKAETSPGYAVANSVWRHESGVNRRFPCLGKAAFCRQHAAHAAEPKEGKPSLSLTEEDGSEIQLRRSLVRIRRCATNYCRTVWLISDSSQGLSLEISQASSSGCRFKSHAKLCPDHPDYESMVRYL